MLHGQVSEVGGLKNGLRGCSLSIGALMKGGCLMMVAKVRNPSRAFSCICRIFSLLYPKSATHHVKGVQLFGTCLLGTCCKRNPEHLSSDTTNTEIITLHPKKNEKLLAPVSVPASAMAPPFQSSKRRSILLFSCDRSGTPRRGQSYLGVDKSHKTTAFQKVQQDGHRTFHLGRHYGRSIR